MKETLAQIHAPKPRAFTAGIVLWDNTVTMAAPIVKYMKGWRRSQVRNYCASKGWKVSVVHELAQRMHTEAHQSFGGADDKTT